MDGSQTSSSMKSISAGLRKIMSNPWVIGIGWILGVLGFVFGVYVYYDSKSERNLIYFVNPARATVVRSDKSSNLVVSYKNEVVRTDITAVQVALWNKGKMSIKKNDVLQPIVLYTGNGAPILEATIRASQREISRLTLDPAESSKGRLKIDWDILEQNDGSVIQIIYAADKDTELKIEGIIEGQKNINQFTKSDSVILLSGFLVFAFAFLVISFTPEIILPSSITGGRWSKIIFWSSILGGLVVSVAISFYAVFWMIQYYRIPMNFD